MFPFPMFNICNRTRQTMGDPPPPSSIRSLLLITCLLELETSFCFHLLTVQFSFWGNRNAFLFPMRGIWKWKRVSVSKWSPWKWKCVSISIMLHLETTPMETVLENSIVRGCTQEFPATKSKKHIEVPHTQQQQRQKE
jgi:hypothetical protein